MVSPGVSFTILALMLFQPGTQSLSAQQSPTATPSTDDMQIEVIMEPDKPSKVLLLHPPKHQEPSLGQSGESSIEVQQTLVDDKSKVPDNELGEYGWAGVWSGQLTRHRITWFKDEVYSVRMKITAEGNGRYRMTNLQEDKTQKQEGDPCPNALGDVFQPSGNTYSVFTPDSVTSVICMASKIDMVLHDDTIDFRDVDLDRGADGVLHDADIVSGSLHRVSLDESSGDSQPDCDALEERVATLRARIRTDQESIRNLKIGVTADELDQWSQAAEDKQREILVGRLTDIANTLASGIVDQASELARSSALQPMDILGVHLPNGIGSLGPGQANAIIGELESRGVTSDTVSGAALITSIRKASLVRDKTEAVQILSQVPSTLRDTHELTSSQTSVDAAATAFQIAADLAGKGNFAAALGTAIFKGVSDIVDGLIISSAVKSLDTANDAQLSALKPLSAQIDKDVKDLQHAKQQLESCGN